MVYSYIRNKKYNNVTIINKMHTQVCAKGDTLYNTIYKRMFYMCTYKYEWRIYFMEYL